MRRLYFVLPDVETARQVERELLLAHIEDRKMHFMSKDGVDLGDLPEATVEEKSDFVHGWESGAIIGGCTALAIGIGILFVTGFSVDMLGVALLLGLAGAAFGFWVSSMVATSVPNTRLARFEKSIEAGNILLMVDVPKERTDELHALIEKHCPGAHYEGVESTIPAFP